MEYFNAHEIPVQYAVSRLCEITKKTNEEYGMKHDAVFDVIVGIQYPDRNSELTYITKIGEPYQTNIATVGSGAPFARVYLSGIETKNMAMQDFVHIAYFIIKYVDSASLDATVGVGMERPHVWYIPDRYTENERGDWEETNFDNFERESKRRINRHKKQLRTLFGSILNNNNYLTTAIRLSKLLCFPEGNLRLPGRVRSVTIILETLFSFTRLQFGKSPLELPPPIW